MAFDNGGAAPNYAAVEPPKADTAGFGHGDAGWPVQGVAGRHDPRAADDPYTQAGNLFRLLPVREKQNLADNIAGALAGVSPEIVQRQLAHFERADPAYGAGVRAALARRGVDTPAA
jgi:catalase